MKKSFLLAAALVVPALIAAAQPDRQPSKPGASPPGAAQPTPPAAATDDAIKGQEQKVWEAVKAQDWSAFGAALADDFVWVTPGGFKDKAATLAEVKGAKLTKAEFSDWKVTRLGENAAVLMYKVDQEWTGAEGKGRKETAYCSSVWTRRGGKWLASTHQETVAQGAAK